MKCLVLGGNEYVGTHLVDVLLGRGYFVRIHDRSPNRFRAAPKNTEYVEGELGNQDLLREALDDVDVVLHFVGITLPKTSNEGLAHDVRSNLIDTIKLLEACVRAGARKVIFASSGGTVYGPLQKVPISEDHGTNPITASSNLRWRSIWALHGLDPDSGTCGTQGRGRRAPRSATFR